MTPQEYEALMRHVRNIGYTRFEAYHEEINAIEAWLAEKNKVMTLDSLRHMQYCSACAESAWEGCEGGRKAIEALAKLDEGKL